MKKDLIKLIDSRKEIEKMFHPFDGGKGTSFERISDVPEFQNWLQEIKLELQGIYDRTHDTFVWETINLCGKRLDGFTEKKYFIELVGKLQAIRKNIDKYYPDEEKESGLSHSQGGASSMKKKPLIFISHSSKNKDQVAKIADLLRSINLSPRRDIFCSSLPGYGIPNGANIFDFLRERFLNYDLHIIFVHSPEYYESPVSLNEMGAAWVLRANATSLLLPGFDFSGMKGVIGSDCIAIKLDGDRSEVKDRLNQLRRELESEFDISDNTQGYETVLLTDFGNLTDELKQYSIELVLLDINLPYENGYEVCRKIKQVMPVPIIFVTSRDTNADELKSIQVGGIDFITKPYDTLILLEKIKRALQLSNPNNFRELVKKDCTLDLHLSILKYQEQSIELTRNEFRILYYFFMNEDKVISKEELLEKLWNDKYYIDENVLLVNMTRLKKKMKEIGIVHLLENIRGKGWKL